MSARRNGSPPEPPVIAGRVPVHSLEAEAAVLSAILLDATTLDRVLEILPDGAPYYSDANRRVYDACVDLSANGKTIDIVSVAAWIRAREWMGQIGGPAYLSQLADATPAVAHVEAHAEVVRELWRQRQMVALCQRIAAEGYSSVGIVQEWLDSCEQAIFDLSRSDTKKPARPLKVLLTKTFKDMTERSAQGRRLAGVSTGYPDLDRKMGGYKAGNFYVLAGRPGHCKSSLAFNSAIHVATPRVIRMEDPDRRGHVAEWADTVTGVGYFSMEMPDEQLSLRAICSEARVNNERADNSELLPDDWRRMMEVAPRLAAMPIFVDDTPAITLLELRAKVRRLQAEFNRPATDAEPERRIEAVFLDFFQLMKGRQDAKTRDDELGWISRGLKQLAKDLRIAVVALSSMNRAIEQRSGKQQEPRLSDLRECGSLESDADTVMFIHVPEVVDPNDRPGIAKINIAKQRGGGSTGIVYLRVDRSCTRLDSLSRAEWPEGVDE